MATFSRVTPGGWLQGDDTTEQSRVGPGGWYHVEGAGGSSPPQLCLSSGALTHKSPTGSDLRLFMSAAGELIASATHPASTRPLSLGAGGQMQAGLSS